MLKIIDNVDLKELERFGFEYHSNKESSYYGCCEFYNKDISIFINNARIMSFRNNTPKTMFDLNVLYDLIQAELVEKVKEE